MWRWLLFGLVPYPSSERWLLLCLASYVEVVVWERSCVLQVCITQILSGGSLCGMSCVDALVEILLCEGGDVEQWLEPRNISLGLRLIHYLLLSLLYLALFHIVHIIHICLVLFVCAHTFVEPRELQIAPQLLFRGIKRSCPELWEFGYTLWLHIVRCI